MSSTEAEDVLDDDEASYTEDDDDEGPWDGPYRDDDDSPISRTPDASSYGSDFEEAMAVMEDLLAEEDDDGLDSDDREFIESMCPDNSIPADCSCRFRARCTCKSDCIPSYIPLWNKSWMDCMVISKSHPYKPPFMWSEGETRGKGYNFGNILRCAEGLSQYIAIYHKRKREEIKCPVHTQEILSYSNYLVLKLVNGSADIESEKEIGNPQPAFDEFCQQIKKIVSVAKFALIQELGVLFPVTLPSLALSRIIDFLFQDFAFAEELEDETRMTLQDTIFLMFESFNFLISPDSTMCGGKAYIDPIRQNIHDIQQNVRAFSKHKADLLILLNQICRPSVIVEPK